MRAEFKQKRSASDQQLAKARQEEKGPGKSSFYSPKLRRKTTATG